MDGPLDDLRQPKIGEQAVPALVNQHIARLHVPVDQSLRVGIVKRIASLRNNGADLEPGEGFARHQAGERAALDERHHNIGVAIRLAEVKDWENVRVLEFGEDAGFLLEAGDELGIAGEVAGKNLERHIPMLRL